MTKQQRRKDGQVVVVMRQQTGLYCLLGPGSWLHCLKANLTKIRGITDLFHVMVTSCHLMEGFWVPVRTYNILF